jgi:transcriptional regulator with GAF, ATPase, and Fis domain
MGRRIQERIVLTVVASLLLAALGISAALYVRNQTRAYHENVIHAEQMIEAASLAFSEALSDRDEVLMDALLHELKSRNELHIEEAYVINREGLVVAHSRDDEYGKTYSLPLLLRQRQPARLSDTEPASNNSFRVATLLQKHGQQLGVLTATFSTYHISQLVRSELFWIIGITAPILVISAVGILIYGGRMTRRLQLLKARALTVGAGDLGESIEVEGSDEISDLTVAFNKMISDLGELRSKENASAAQIESLNRDISAQLRKVEELKEQLAEENAALRRELSSSYSAGDIIGFNGGLREVADQVRQLTSLPVTVLITGETGTGKELIARYLHEAGARSRGPFIGVNCAALPLTLIESELFGHEKGAFTGASSQKKGKFELAHKGTLFLDEVGELPAEAQAKLLRALQQGEIVRVGGERPLSVDVRLVAATNRNLAEEVRRARFREDLYYRLKVVELKCPPLRERLEDLPALAQHFVETYSRKLGKGVIGISASALKTLGSYWWPGNIRELENTLARAVALATTQVLGPDDFSMLRSGEKMNVAGTNGFNIDGLSIRTLQGNGLDAFLEDCERRLVQSAMEIHKTQKEAADALNLTPTKLHRLLKKHGLIRGEMIKEFQK